MEQLEKAMARNQVTWSYKGSLGPRGKECSCLRGSETKARPWRAKGCLGAGNANYSPTRGDRLQSNRELTVCPVFLGLGVKLWAPTGSWGCLCQSRAGTVPLALGHGSSHQSPERELWGTLHPDHQGCLPSQQNRARLGEKLRAIGLQ